MREKFGARVMFPTKTNGDDSEIITIIGRKEKVDAAKKHMEEMIKDLENITEDTITVDPKHHRHFIQRRGQVWRETHNRGDCDSHFIDSLRLYYDLFVYSRMELSLIGQFLSYHFWETCVTVISTSSPWYREFFPSHFTL